MSAYGYQAHRWANQCIHCGHIRSTRVVHFHCPSCKERVLFEAIDQPYCTCNSIDLTRIALLAQNIAQAGYMEWARRLGRLESIP